MEMTDIETTEAAHPVLMTPKAVQMVKLTRQEESLDESHGLRVAVIGATGAFALALAQAQGVEHFRAVQAHEPHRILAFDLEIFPVAHDSIPSNC